MGSYILSILLSGVQNQITLPSPYQTVTGEHPLSMETDFISVQFSLKTLNSKYSCILCFKPFYLQPVQLHYPIFVAIRFILPLICMRRVRCKIDFLLGVLSFSVKSDII